MATNSRTTVELRAEGCQTKSGNGKKKKSAHKDSSKEGQKAQKEAVECTETAQGHSEQLREVAEVPAQVQRQSTQVGKEPSPWWDVNTSNDDPSSENGRRETYADLDEIQTADNHHTQGESETGRASNSDRKESNDDTKVTSPMVSILESDMSFVDHLLVVQELAPEVARNLRTMLHEFQSQGDCHASFRGKCIPQRDDC